MYAQNDSEGLNFGVDKMGKQTNKQTNKQIHHDGKKYGSACTISFDLFG